MTYRIGGRSLRYSETIDSKWFPANNTIGVHVIREATLNDTLSQIETRRLQAVVVTLGRDEVLSLDYEAAHWLYLALTSAVDSVRDLGPDEIQPWEQRILDEVDKEPE